MIIEQREIDEIVEGEKLSKNQLYLPEISKGSIHNFMIGTVGI